MSTNVFLAVMGSIGDIPHLKDAGCRTEKGFAAMTAYMEGRNGANPGILGEARKVCENLCPLATKAACLAWVMTSEKSAGGWGGMYAGLTPNQRVAGWHRLSAPERALAARFAVKALLDEQAS